MEKKPYTYGPKKDAARRHVLVRISVEDIDAWIRSTWPEMAEEEWDMA